MKKQLKPKWLLLYLCIAPAITGKTLRAQIIVNSAAMSYTQNFNTLDTASSNSSNLPPGWEIFEYGTSATLVNNQYKGNSGASSTGDTYSYGSPASTDRALGSIATSGNRASYGAIFRNNTGVVITSVAVTYRGEQWRRGTCTSDTLQFRYSTSAVNIADTLANKWIIHNKLSLTSIYSGSITGAALDGNETGNYIMKSDTVTVNILPGDSLLLEWVDRDVSGSDDGLAIDDLSVVFMTNVPPIPDHIYITGKSPEGENIQPATNELRIKFDHLIEQGSGQIALHKNGANLPITISIPSTQISISDSTAIVSNILLENKSQYHVLLTEGSFKKAGSTISNVAITNTSDWIFTTADTIIIRPLTVLNESFQNCLDTVLGVFKPYSVEGFKTWRCSGSGRDDNAAVSMTGGVTDGISNKNTDWLISRLAFDFSAMSKPELSFWHKRRFTGSVSRALKISYDYVSGNNPEMATWTTLQVQDMIEDPLEDWMPISDIDLTPYKYNPFFLAFTYSCEENGAYELSYDDIKVQDEALGISVIKANPFALQIIGEATAHEINIAVTTKKHEALTIEIFDLAGRSKYKTLMETNTGTRIHTIKDSGLLPGIYLMRIYNDHEDGAIKVLIR